MLLAPSPHFTATLTRAPNGRAGVFHTLALMRRAVNEGKTDAAVIQAAISVIYLTPEKDEYSEVSSLFYWVRDYIRYVRDPHGVESLTSPAMTLRRMIGDCDDQVTLLCALFEAVGYPSRFVVAAYTVPGNFEHVYCQVFACGQWIDCDPTESEAMGYAPPGALTLFIEGE